MSPYLLLSIREVWRSKAVKTIWVLLVLLYGLGLLVPPRLGAAAAMALETWIAIEVLGSTLFAAIVVAWPMGQANWPWSPAQVGLLSRSPHAVLQRMALGQGLVWLLFLLSLMMAAVLGIGLQSLLMGTGAWEELAWSRFFLASLVVFLMGFWLQAMARFLGAFLPSAMATLVLLIILIAGHFLGLQSIEPAESLSWFRPGFEYLSQAQALRSSVSDLATIFGLSLAGTLCFNLLAAWILGRRVGGLVNLDPEGSGD